MILLKKLVLVSSEIYSNEGQVIMDTMNLTAVRNIDTLLSYVDYYYP